MAAPVLGGLLIADEVVDIFIPVRFYWVRRYRWLKMHGIDEATAGYDEAVRAEQFHETRQTGSLNPAGRRYRRSALRPVETTHLSRVHENAPQLAGHRGFRTPPNVLAAGRNDEIPVSVLKFIHSLHFLDFRCKLSRSRIAAMRCRRQLANRRII